jgi:uncharacterized protein with ParB-like and HNH nuclease domain
MQFTTEQKVLEDLFGNNINYIIPEYQRPYSWDCIGKSDKNNQVNVMWDDLIDFYESKNPNIYFMGSMVVIGDSITRIYEVVDGQQRLTTLTILFTAIKCFLNEIYEKKNIEAENQEDLLAFIKAAADNVDRLIFNEKRTGFYRNPEKKVKIQSTVGFNYDMVLKMVMECGDMDASVIPLKNASNEQKEVTHRYFNNRQYFITQLKHKFLANGLFNYEQAEALEHFFDFLKNKITIIQIRSPKFDVAYQIFEILNNRGLPLSNKDLFRNFLISEFHLLKSSNEHKFAKIDPQQKWRDLEINYEFDAEFISRYVESKKGRKQQYSAFNDLQEIYKRDFKDSLVQQKIEAFYEDINAYLLNYAKILAPTFDNKQLKNCVILLTLSGNLSSISNLLLALFTKTSQEDDILAFLKIFEKYVLHSSLSTTKRFNNKLIYHAITAINAGDLAGGMAVFALDASEQATLKQLLDAPIKDNDTAKLIIAKYYFALDNAMPDDVVQQQLDISKATLEHIIPQTPDPATNWIRDFSTKFRTKYTYKLGNMTLLTQKMNSAAKNYDFAKKKNIYAQAKLAMTNAVGELQNIDEAFIENRHKNIVEVIVKDLGL